MVNSPSKEALVNASKALIPLHVPSNNPSTQTGDLLLYRRCHLYLCLGLAWTKILVRYLFAYAQDQALDLALLSPWRYL